MRYLPNALLVLALPAGLLGYLLGTAVMTALPLPEAVGGLLVVFAPLFVAGLFMVPFVVPFIDRKARQDLAAHRRSEEAAANDTTRRSRRG